MLDEITRIRACPHCRHVPGVLEPGDMRCDECGRHFRVLEYHLSGERILLTDAYDIEFDERLEVMR